MAEIQQNPDSPGWLNVLSGTIDRYLSANAEAELTATGDALLQIARSDSVHRAPRGTRLVIRDRIARAFSTRYINTREPAALDSAIVVGLDMADDIRMQFGAKSDLTAAALAQVGHDLSKRALDRGDPGDINRAIELLRDADDTKALPADKRPQLFTGLGSALSARYSHSHDVKDLDECIQMWKAATDEIPDDSPERPPCLRNLGDMLAQRFAITGDRADIDLALSLLDQAVAATHSDSRWLTSRREALLAVLRTHFDATSDPSDLDRMAELLETLAQDVRPPVRRMYLAELASVLDDKGTFFGGQLSTRVRGVEILEGLFAETPANDPQRLEYQAQLAMALHQLAQQTDDLELTDRAFKHAAEALEAVAADAPRRPAFIRDLAVILRGRAKLTGSRDDVDEAIRLLEQLDKDDVSAPGAYVPLVSLGNALLLRFQLGGKAEDLDRAVEIMEKAVTRTRPQTSERLVALRNLTAALNVHHATTASPADLERLTSVRQERARGGESVIGSRDDARRLVGEYDATGDLGSLDAAIADLKARLTTVPAESPANHRALMNLGLALWKKYEHTGDLDLLNQAIQIYEERLAVLPIESALRPAAQAKLALCLRDRYIRTADAADLNRAIASYRDVLVSASVDEDVVYEVYGNLGLALWDRYVAIGNLQDLNNAITITEAQAALPAAEGRHDDMGFNTLGLALRDRYPHSHDPEDLARAVHAHEMALKLTSPSSPLHGIRLNNLGGTYYYRWLQSRDPTDLDRAIEAFEKSSKAGAPYPANRLRAVSNLAVTLRNRYNQTRVPADLDRAIAMGETAIADPSESPADFSLSFKALADALHTRYNQIGRRSDLQRGIRAYKESCAHGQYSRVSVGLQAAETWCHWAIHRGAWQEAAEAGELAATAMIRLYQNQYGRPDKESWLAASHGVPAMAAYAIAMAGNPARAVVVLESTRALLLSEALHQDRANLVSLIAIGCGDLVNRYQQAAERWTQLMSLLDQSSLAESDSLILHTHDTAASPETSRFLTSWEHGERLQAARTELDAAIGSIREIPGQSHFLQALGIEDIQAAAASAPLVYLVAVDHEGIALIVRGADDPEQQVKTVRLPELTTAEVDEWVTTFRAAHDRREDEPSWRGALDPITARLWSAVMGPVIAALGGATAAILIPTGRLVMVPLHAAWTTDATRPSGRLYAGDVMTLSFAPNAASLLGAAEAATRSIADSLLLIEEPLPSGYGPLPFAQAEASSVAAQFVQPVVLRRQEATVGAVVGALDGHSVHHFTCHAIANLISPLESALILADDQPLTLRELLNLRANRPGRPDVRLAVLAACETQVPGEELPDEVIGLPAGLMQSGAAGVIASQWAVSGLATAMLMIRFYQYWKHDQLPPAAALQSAQRWLRDSTNGEKADYFEAAMSDESSIGTDTARTLWREMVRKPPSNRSHAHISEWAAFVHLGV